MYIEESRNFLHKANIIKHSKSMALTSGSIRQLDMQQIKRWTRRNSCKLNEGDGDVEFTHFTQNLKQKKKKKKRILSLSMTLNYDHDQRGKGCSIYNVRSLHILGHQV